MKISAIYGTMPGNDYGLVKVLAIIKQTLSELGIEMNEINLAYLQVPYFDGNASTTTDEIIKAAATSDGIILATSVNALSPSALMQTFLEYLELNEYGERLRNKNCFLVAVSNNGGERHTLDYLKALVNRYDAYDSLTLGLNSNYIENLDNEEIRGSIEKLAEDFYRIVRANRRYFIPTDTTTVRRVYDDRPGSIESSKPKVPFSQVYKDLQLDNFNQRQQDDINELTSFFTSKYSEHESGAKSAIKKPKLSEVMSQEFTEDATFRPKSCQQMSKALPHYFKSNLSGGLTAVFQFNITGEETFDGYLSIKNTECEFSYGIYSTPDITIIADSSVWSDILSNKFTAQKAFMIGRLKVRGNFVLLTRFDLLFGKG